MITSDRRKFKVLLLEDDRSVDEAVRQFADVITWVNNVEQGKTEILLGFFDLAIVDVTLLKTPDGNELAELGGLDCCRWLRDFLPSCERVIWSRTGLNDFDPSDLMQEVRLHDFFPGTPLVTSVVKKSEYDNSLEKLVSLRLRYWEKQRALLKFVRSNQSSAFEAKLHDWFNGIKDETLLNLPKIDSSAIAGEQLEEIKKKRHEDVKARLKQSLADETEYLIEHLCGQRPIHELSLSKMLELNASVEFADPTEEWDLGSEKLVDELVIYELPKQGKSSALTFCARPTLFGMTSDVWLLIKIDLKKRVEQEVQNYERYWKYVVGRNRRTELLGFASGSRLGAICYVFVGVDGKQPEPIGFESFSNPTEIRSFISRLFETRDLHRVTSNNKKKGPIGYFKDRFGKNDWPKLWTDALEILKKSVELDLSDIGNNNPTQLQLFERAYPLTLAHGDLHFGNIIAADVSSFLLIDYRDSGWCPRPLDYVFLEASLRTDFARVEQNNNKILSANRFSMGVFRDFWNSPEFSTIDSEPEVDDLQRGIPINYQILNAGVKSILYYFKKTFEDADSIEYTSIALGWSLILSGNSKLSGFERLATSLWAVSLGKYLVEISGKLK
jgi:hypothetical protein